LHATVSKGLPITAPYARLIAGIKVGDGNVDLSVKQQQFNAAMELYNTRPAYKQFGLLISFTNVFLQAFLLGSLLPLSIGIAGHVVAFLSAYLLTDFINGLVHLYMDNNDRYTSVDGPFIANFHLHHMLPQYTKRRLIIVYFMESGSKVWLVPYLLLVLVLGYFNIPSTLYCVLVYTGVLSSVAEVSHYLCHTSTAQPVLLLEKCGLLLSKKRHARHHLQDNCNYTFLNGFTDPLVNLIAKRFCGGYKHRSDLHFARYSGLDRDSR
jgi:hypothetical protein